jgi:phage shock protein PspC (stress-responsive transcriptional regulator)
MQGENVNKMLSPQYILKLEKKFTILRSNFEYATTMEKRLLRSNDQVIAGVCAGIAEYFGWDKGLVRLIYLLISLFSAAFPGVIVYIVLWIIMPRRTDTIYM